MKIEEFYLSTDVGRFFVKCWLPLEGQTKAPIVLLHDSLGCVGLWRSFPGQLAQQLSRPVIAYDRLGFGKSDSRLRLPGVDFIEQEANVYFPDIKSALKLNNYILLGHSVGGAMAINIAASDKSCLAAITIAAQAFVEELTLNGIETAKRLFQQPEQFEKLKKWHGDKALSVLKAWTDIWLTPKFRDWRLSAIYEVECPLLVMHGENDEYGSLAFPTFIAEGSKGLSQLNIIENCGHMPHKTHNADVLDAVQQFVRQVINLNSA